MNQARKWGAFIALLFLVSCEGGSTQNPIQEENAKPGDASWIIPAANRAWHRIEGYASPPSVNRGGSIEFFVTTDEPSYVMKIYRLGWYGGDGARLLKTVELTGIDQDVRGPTCPMDATVNLEDCDWKTPYVLKVPYDPGDPTAWASGIYLAQLTQSESGKQNYIPFVVRDDTRPSAVKFVSSTLTWHAYNSWGHYSLYKGGPTQVFTDRARKVSLNRPFYDGFGAGDLLNLGYELSALRFLEREGYNVSYTTEIDLHENSSELLSTRVAFFGGHTEYWTRTMRDNLQAAIDAGVSAIFTDADSIYWQSRLESDSAGVRDRILVCYKDASEDPDSSNPDTSADTTVEFREPPVNWPEEPLIGLMFNHNSELGVSGDVVISDDSNWIFAGTGLRNGDHLAHFLGPEVDSSHGHSPAATDIVAESPFQSTIGSGVAEMSVYRARSGAYVFDSGTSRFNYGLDDFYDLALDFSPNLVGLSTNPRGSPEVQQMVRNLLSRMGARY